MYNFLLEAFIEAEKALIEDEVPVGAVLVKNNNILARYHNMNQKYNDPTAHAEILCIRKASKIINSLYLNQCELYVTLEPCAMCAQAIAFSKINSLYFAAYDEKYGAVNNGPKIFKQKINKNIEIYGGIMEDKAIALMKKFFHNKRR